MRYACYDHEITAIGQHAVRVESADGEARVLEGTDAYLFRLCARPRTLEQHAAAFLGGGSPGEARRADVEARLRRYVLEGLLVGEEALARRIASAGRRSVPARIGSVGLPTRDRPEPLRRALESLMRNDADYGRDTEFVVVDDGTASGVSEAVLSSAAAKYGRRARLATREGRREFARALARRAHVPEGLVRFALEGDPRCGARFGAPRNVLLLDTAGGLSVHTDDDTVCSVGRLPGATAGLSISAAADAHEYRFMDTMDEALAGVHAVNVDLLAAHEWVLGRTPAECVAAALGRGEAVEITGDARCVRIASNEEARIAITLPGTVGDCGGPAPQGTRALAHGPTFEWLVADEARYASRLVSRRLSKSPARYTISTGAHFAAISFGVDARALLAPFAPVQTAEDTLFGAVHGYTSPYSLSAFIPYTVVHDPDGARPNPAWPLSFVHLANEVMRQMVQRFAPVWPAAEPADALEALGGYLRSLGELAPARFRSFVEGQARAAMIAEAAQWESVLAQRPDTPAFWKDSVRDLVARRRAWALASTPASPCDLPGLAPERQALFQSIVQRYGELLACWPAIARAAAELRAAEVRPSRALRD